VFPTKVQALDLLLQVIRKFLQWGQHRIGGKCSYHGEKNSPEIILPHHRQLFSESLHLGNLKVM
jgi:hypothetical protein